MKTELDIDIRSAIYEIREGFKDLSNAQVNLALARTLNQMIKTAQVDAAKSIRGKYKVKASFIKSQMKPKKTSRQALTATLNVSIKPIPVYSFGAKANAMGVSANIMGKRVQIDGAFIARMQSGHIGVYARGGYQGKDFLFSHTHTPLRGGKAFTKWGKWGSGQPIEEIVTASPFSMITNRAVSKSLSKSIETKFPNVFINNLTSVRKGF